MGWEDGQDDWMGNERMIGWEMGGWMMIGDSLSGESSCWQRMVVVCEIVRSQNLSVQARTTEAAWVLSAWATNCDFSRS